MFSAAGKSAVTSGYNINNSLRLRSSASAYLSRTPASAGNLRKWTYSAWVKRGRIGTGSGFYQNLLDATGPSNVYHNIRFIDNNLTFTLDNTVTIGTTAVFRDPSAWCHIVVIWDTPNATSTDRMILYVNGVRQTVTIQSGSYPTQNTDGQVNSTNAHAIGRYVYGNAQFFDGHITEINFIDGSALTPSSFGETDGTTGVWKPKKFVGSYGTNGFYLPFSDIATTSGSNAGLGKDFSGNGNYWTTNNISVTAGTTYDAMLDSPTNTSATVANYAVLNPLDSYSTAISNGNLKFADGSGSAYQAYSTMSNPDIVTYKFYCEVTVDAGYLVGIVPETKSATGATADRTGVLGYYSNGNKYNNTTASAYGATFTANDVIGIAFGNGQVEFFKNNVSQGVAFSSLTGGYKVATWAAGATGVGCSFNFGQRPFTYTPPSGFVALNTFNLADSTIKKGSSYMDATTYTGTGSAQSITNSAGMQPDLVWIKSRSAVSYHGLTDSVRGRAYPLFSNATDAEGTSASDKDLTSFNSNGFSLGVGNQYNSNGNGDTFVAWQWRAGSGTTTVNTSGSISSNVSVNTTAGFSIVTYTGTGVAGTVGHGLGATPKLVILKRRNSATNGDWCVYTSSLPATNGLFLNTTDGSTVVNSWNNTAPTSSVFSISNSVGVNASGSTYVAYCWAAIAGFSAFGSYTGNGSADGPFVYTGFRPKFIIIKQSSAAGENWVMYDTVRNTYNVANLLLHPNLSNAESTTTLNPIDILSNGFKLRGSSGLTNTSSATYIYMAFAENPFKNALAR